MCHHRGEKRPWMESAAEEEPAEEAAEELPSFLNEDGTDTELLTDGGDDE